MAAIGLIAAEARLYDYALGDASSERSSAVFGTLERILLQVPPLVLVTNKAFDSSATKKMSLP